MPNVIIKPQGRPLYRITLEIDKNHQLQIKPEDLTIPGLTRELPLSITAQTLWQAANTAIMALFQSFARLEKPNGADTTEKEKDHNRPV